MIGFAATPGMVPPHEGTPRGQRTVSTASRQSASRPQVVLFDPLATVPYYTAYLARALAGVGAHIQLCSISYYLDPQCFTSRNLRTDPGLVDAVGRFHLPPAPRRVLKLVEMAANLAALRVRFRREVPAVLHVQFLPLLRSTLPLDLIFVRYCQRRGSRVVLTVHDLLPHDTANRHQELFQQLYRSVDALICHSDHIRSRLVQEFGISLDRIFVIPHGPFFYDLPAAGSSTLHARLGVPPARKVVLWQGILHPYKGLDVLLQAWQELEAQAGDGHLVILGTGPPEMLAAVRTQVAQLGLERVTLDLRFCTTEELVEAYRAAEVVVYPYRAITTSGALATGLALGKAIVASDLPVFRELLIDGQNALLAAPGEAALLAQQIQRLLRDSALRENLIQAVQTMHFGDASWRAIARDTVHVYEEVLRFERHASVKES